MKKLYVIYMVMVAYYGIVCCENNSKKSVIGKWELQNVFLRDDQKWGKMNNCNRFDVQMDLGGELKLGNYDCKNDLPSDVVAKFEWKLSTDTLIFEVLGKGKLLYVNDSLMIIDFFDKKIRQGIYYFKRNG